MSKIEQSRGQGRIGLRSAGATLGFKSKRTSGSGLSGWNIFVANLSKEMGISFRETLPLAKAKWDKLSAEGKQVFQNRASQIRKQKKQIREELSERGVINILMSNRTINKKVNDELKRRSAGVPRLPARRPRTRKRLAEFPQFERPKAPARRPRTRKILPEFDVPLGTDIDPKAQERKSVLQELFEQEQLTVEMGEREIMFARIRQLIDKHINAFLK